MNQPSFDPSSTSDQDQACLHSLRKLGWDFCDNPHGGLAKREGLMRLVRSLYGVLDLDEEERQQLMPVDEIVQVLLRWKYEGRELFQSWGMQAYDLVDRQCLTEREAIGTLKALIESGVPLNGQSSDGRFRSQEPPLWHYRAYPLLFKTYLEACDTRLSNQDRDALYHVQCGPYTLIFDLIAHLDGERILHCLGYLLDSQYPKEQTDPTGCNALAFACRWGLRQPMQCLSLLIEKGFDPYIPQSFPGFTRTVSADEYIHMLMAKGKYSAEERNLYAETLRKTVEKHIPESTKPFNPFSRI